MNVPSLLVLFRDGLDSEIRDRAMVAIQEVPGVQRACLLMPDSRISALQRYCYVDLRPEVDPSTVIPVLQVVIGVDRVEQPVGRHLIAPRPSDPD